MKKIKLSRPFLTQRIFILAAISLALSFAAVLSQAQSTLTFTEWAVPTSSNCSFGLVPVSWNVIYFTDAPCGGTAKVGRLNTTTNTVTEWAGGELVSPQGVVALGRLVLFTDQAAGTIDMLNPLTNQLTTWAVPTPGSGPLRVVAMGFEIFFTEEAGRIGMLNLLNNKMTEWTVPGGPHTPLSIAYSGGNRIWFSQASGAQLGALDLTDNTFQQWTIPSSLLPSLFIQGIAVSEEGHVFFGDSSPDSAVGRLDPIANVVTVWTTPTPSGPTQLLVQELGEARSEAREAFMVDFTDPPGNSMWRLLTNLQTGTSSTIPATATGVAPTVTSVTPATSTLTLTSAVVKPTITNVAGSRNGGFEQWTVPTTNSNNYAIARLPGGGVAFTEANGNKIGSLR